MPRNELVKYYQADDVLEVSGLRNGISLPVVYLNSGVTATVTVVDSAGVEVVGQLWPLTLDYFAASDGIYRATLADSMVLIPGDWYTAQLTIDAGSGLKDYREFPLEVVVKGAHD